MTVAIHEQRYTERSVRAVNRKLGIRDTAQNIGGTSNLISTDHLLMGHPNSCKPKLNV